MVLVDEVLLDNNEELYHKKLGVRKKKMMKEMS